MNNYKKFTMWFFGLELFLIAIANGLYYMTANNQKTDIERLQDKTDTIYKSFICRQITEHGFS